MTYFVKRGNKYNNTPKLYDGKMYDSKKEASYAQELDLRLKAKDIKAWDRQVKVSLDVNGQHVCNYYIDFKITHNDDSIEWVEIKGFATAVFQLKKRLFEILLPIISPGSIYTIVK